MIRQDSLTSFTQTGVDNMEITDKYFLQPGYIFATEQPYLIHTVLGSCVSVCLWDSVNKFGGMNHYIYSKAGQGTPNARYGNVSIPYLIKLMIQMGTRIENVKAHIIGGGQNPELSSDIGIDNVSIAEEILSKVGIKYITRDVGGTIGRKVIFNTESGEVLVYKVINVRKSDWY